MGSLLCCDLWNLNLMCIHIVDECLYLTSYYSASNMFYLLFQPWEMWNISLRDIHWLVVMNFVCPSQSWCMSQPWWRDRCIELNIDLNCQVMALSLLDCGPQVSDDQLTWRFVSFHLAMNPIGIKWLKPTCCWDVFQAHKSSEWNK